MPNTRSSASKPRQTKSVSEPASSENDSPRRPGRNARTKITKSRPISHLGETPNDEPSPFASSQANPNRSSLDYSFGEAETSGDEGIFTQPHRTRTLPKRKEDDFIVPDDEVEESEESDESDDVMISRRKDLPDSDSAKESSLDGPPRGIKRKRNHKILASESEESDRVMNHEATTDEEDEVPVIRRRSIKTPTKTEEDEILDELEDLQDDSPLMDSGSKSREAAIRRRETLERMRKTRFGEASSDSGLEKSDYNESEEDLPLIGAPGSEFDEEDEFIEEDDTEVQLPFEFSHDAAASAEDMFKDMLHWMVHLILRDVVLEDELYKLAHNKIQREFGQWGESFRSSAWRPEFINELIARPEIHTRMLFREAQVGDQCQGCNRADTYSTAEIWFSGNPYDPDTLRDLDQIPDEPLVDGKGRELLDQMFLLGKTCFGNAIVAHPLEHWKYRLKKLLEEEYLADEIVTREIKRRKTWSESKKISHANEVAGNLVEGCSTELWLRLKQSVSNAWDIRSKS